MRVSVLLQFVALRSQLVWYDDDRFLVVCQLFLMSSGKAIDLASFSLEFGLQ